MKRNSVFFFIRKKYIIILKRAGYKEKKELRFKKRVVYKGKKGINNFEIKGFKRMIEVTFFVFIIIDRSFNLWIDL